jgi:hypothetical protein
VRGGVGPCPASRPSHVAPSEKINSSPAPRPYSLGVAGGGGSKGGESAPNSELFSPFSLLRNAYRWGIGLYPPETVPELPMNLLGWLRNRERAPGDVVTRAEFASLAARLEALDEIQLQREMAWKEIRDQLKRYLSRAAAYEQRAREREGNEADPTTAALLQLKFSNNRGA